MKLLEATVSFNLSALGILLVLGFFYRRSGRSPLRKYQILLAIIWLVAVSALCSVGTTLLGKSSGWGRELLSQTYFTAHWLLIFAMGLYIQALTDYDLSRKKQLIPWLVLTVVSLLLGSLSGGRVYRLGADGRWIRGTLAWAGDVLGLAKFALLFYMTYRSWKAISMQERVFTVAMLYALTITAALSVPRMENFVTALCVLLRQLSAPGRQQMEDPTTGMLNQQGFTEFVNPALSMQWEFPVGFLMVDNFYALENTYGYTQLTPRLVQLSDFLKGHTGVVFARVERGVFSFVPASFRPGAEWELLLRDLEETALTSRLYQRTAGPQIQVKVGVVHCPREADSIRSLAQMFDMAARYRTPKGKQVTWLDEEDLHYLQRRRQLEQLVRTAVEDGRVSMVYQPVFDVKNQCFCGAEALMRMQTEAFGSVAPAEFIPIAQETGSIYQLSRFAVDTVCRTLRSADWTALGLQWVSVNLSAADCAGEDFAARLLEDIRRSGVKPERLGIELSEAALNALPAGRLGALEDLSQAGVNVMLDDFGTDGGSLNQLCAAPVRIVKMDKSLVDYAASVVKLDRSLLADSGSNAGRLTLENAICTVRRLGKKVLAEGVETREQAEYLTELGVDYMQGYYYARPMDSKSLESFFRDALRLIPIQPVP